MSQYVSNLKRSAYGIGTTLLMWAVSGSTQPILQQQHEPPLRKQYSATDAVSSRAAAEAAMEAGNYAEAYCMLKPLATRGDAESQYNMGWMFANGYGLKVDEHTALSWWLKAAQQRHPDAQFAVAMAYLTGEGAKKDELAAMKWLYMAAQQNVDDAALIIRNRVSRGSQAATSFFSEKLKTDWSAFQERRWVKVARANMRNRANKNGKLIMTLNQGHELVFLRKTGNWTQVGVTKDGRIGWIYAPLLGKEEVPVVKENS